MFTFYHGVGQGHIHHEVPLIFIILNVASFTTFYNNMLYMSMGDCIYGYGGHLMHVLLQVYFSTMVLLFLTKLLYFKVHTKYNLLIHCIPMHPLVSFLYSDQWA